MGTKVEGQKMTLYGEDEEFDFSDQKIEYVTDRGGNSLKMQVFDGKYYPTFFSVKNLQRTKVFEMRPDDVYMPGYPRTGTHWTYEIIRMVLAGKAETVKMWKGMAQTELAPPGFLEGLPSPRVLAAHVILQEGPEEIKSKKCKIVYNLRDPRDVAVSQYLMLTGSYAMTEYKGRFEDFLYLFLEGKIDSNGYFEHTRKCEQYLDENPDVPCHFMYYEETLRDPVLTIQRLSKFLGQPPNDNLCKAIAEKCSFSKMVVDKDKYMVHVDGKSILFGKGVSGRWRQYFTDEMLEDYYRVYEEKMASSRFYRKEYARPCPDEEDNCLSR